MNLLKIESQNNKTKKKKTIEQLKTHQNIYNMKIASLKTHTFMPP